MKPDNWSLANGDGVVTGVLSFLNFDLKYFRITKQKQCCLSLPYN